MRFACDTIPLEALVGSVHLLHCRSIGSYDFTFLNSLSLTAGVLKFWFLHWRLALVLLELVQFCCFVVIGLPGLLCSEAVGPFGVAYNSFSMYQAASGEGTLETSDDTSVVPQITVAKRYRKQASQSGLDDFVCIAEQSGLADDQVISAVVSAGASTIETSESALLASTPTPGIPVAQSDSQLFSTPVPACTPLQLLDDAQESTVEDHEHALGSPAKPGSVSSQEFLSATEPFSAILGDEPVHALHSLPQPAAISAGSVCGTSSAQAEGAFSHNALVQTRSSLPCKRTAWDIGRSSSRATSKACHSLLGSSALPSKPVHVLRNTASPQPGWPRPRPVPSKRGAYAAYPSLQNPQPTSGLMVKAIPPAGNPATSDVSRGPLQVRLSGPSTEGSAHLGSILQASTTKAPTVCTSAQVHAKNWAKALRLWKDLCITLMTASSCLPDIFSSANCDKLLEKLLCRVSDTTALRYISSAVKMISALQDLGLPLEAPSQVQLIDSWLAAQKESGRDTSLHSENALKALRWLKQTAALHLWPDLYQALFATGAWKQVSPRKESIPLPLAFVVWLETRILMDAFDTCTTVFAGAVLLCIWGSLRFSDVQHVLWSDSILDDTSFRAASYRTKTSRFMPFGIHCGGFYQRPASQSWLLRWLQAFESVSSTHLQSDFCITFADRDLDMHSRQ